MVFIIPRISDCLNVFMAFDCVTSKLDGERFRTTSSSGHSSAAQLPNCFKDWGGLAFPRKEAFLPSNDFMIDEKGSYHHECFT